MLPHIALFTGLITTFSSDVYLKNLNCKSADVVIMGTVQPDAEVYAKPVGPGSLPFTRATFDVEAVIAGADPGPIVFETVGDHVHEHGKQVVGQPSWAPGTRHVLGLQWWPGDEDASAEWIRVLDLSVPPEDGVPSATVLRMMHRHQCAEHRDDVEPLPEGLSTAIRALTGS